MGLFPDLIETNEIAPHRNNPDAFLVYANRMVCTKSGGSVVWFANSWIMAILQLCPVEGGTCEVLHEFSGIAATGTKPFPGTKQGLKDYLATAERNARGRRSNL
jgi:hypothetical protein